MRKVGRLISTLQDHYPERLQKALLLRANGIFIAAFKIISTFIDPITAAKVAFVPATAEAERKALDAVGAWHLHPTAYGGPNEAPLPVPNLPGEPNITAPDLVPS